MAQEKRGTCSLTAQLGTTRHGTARHPHAVDVRGDVAATRSQQQGGVFHLPRRVRLFVRGHREGRRARKRMSGVRKRRREKKRQIKGEKGGRETGVDSSWATLETGPGRSRRKGRAGVLPSGSCLPPGTSRPAGGRASCCRFTFSRIMCPSAARARKYVCTHHRVPCIHRRMVSRCISEVGRWIGG